VSMLPMSASSLDWTVIVCVNRTIARTQSMKNDVACVMYMNNINVKDSSIRSRDPMIATKSLMPSLPYLAVDENHSMATSNPLLDSSCLLLLVLAVHARPEQQFS